jgi:hypothetical protein
VHAACRQLLLDAALSFPPASSSRSPASYPQSLILFFWRLPSCINPRFHLFHNSRVCLSSRKISITSPAGTTSGRRTVTGREKIVRRVRSQRALPKVRLIDLYHLLFTYAVSFTSQGSLPCPLQVLQGRLLYRRGLVSLLPFKQ